MVINCSRCGKENQDHYKFCLGCGAELGGEEAPPASAQPTADEVPVGSAGVLDPGHGVGGAGGLHDHQSRPGPSPTPYPPQPQPMVPPGNGGSVPYAAPSPAPAPAAPLVACAACGAQNPQEFVFCGNCGHRMLDAPPAPGQARFDAPPPAATPPAPAAPSPPQAPVARMALIRPDGTEGGSHLVSDHDALIGRGIGPLFDTDNYLSPRHARLVYQGDHFIIEDLDSLNGVFVRIVNEEPLIGGDIFRIGQELLRFDAIGPPQAAADGSEILGSPNPGYWGRLSLIVSEGIDGSAFPLMGEETVLGRERGDILFSDDGYVSGTHAKVTYRQDGIFLADLGSSNGTFLRLREPRAIPYGAFVLMGQQLFRIDMPH